VTIACGDYDRTAALASGEVPVEGADLTWLPLSPEETFFRMLRYREFDAAEMSLSSYVMTLERDAGFIAIPVFPSRAFRHNAIYVAPASGITGTADLPGRVAGLAEWQLTANVWIKGILAERHRVPVASLSYRTGGLHEPGRVPKVAHDMPPGVSVTPIPPGRTLSAMLASGEIDVLYTPRLPEAYASGSASRLFADPRPEEERYFADTGIFPIMHVVALRRDVYELRPWLARSLYKAFSAALSLAMSRAAETAANRYLLPWSYAETERTWQAMGRDFWTYGLAGNEHTLRTFLRYSREQGLIGKEPTLESLFAPETLETYVI
jgi:4,5-dihydroxyphthalate decarboxylase